MIIENLPAAEYHARPELNFSRLKRMAKSPFHFKNAPKETSTAFALGSATHTAILEPETWHRRYQLQAVGRRQGKAWEEELAAAESAGREILRADEWMAAETMADRVSSKPAARRLLLGARKEVTVVTTLRDVPVRCRVDFVQEEKNINFHDGDPLRLVAVVQVPGALGDLKTCRDLSRFASDVEKFSYLAQAAFYSDIWTAETGEKLPWKWLAIENAAPHDCAVIATSTADIDAGRELYLGWMEQHAECVTSGQWHGFDGGADEVQLVRPEWAQLAIEEDE